MHVRAIPPDVDIGAVPPDIDTHTTPLPWFVLPCGGSWLLIYGANYAKLKVNVDAVMKETGGEAPASIQ